VREPQRRQQHEVKFTHLVQAAHSQIDMIVSPSHGRRL
jgi:hypothetical protein